MVIHQTALSLLILLSAFSSSTGAENVEEGKPASQAGPEYDRVKFNPDHKDPAFIKVVEEALQVVQKESPQINTDALNVWKKFQSNSRAINYTYRFWGRRLILWLQDQKKVIFDSEEKVGEVFKVLWAKGLISKNAVVVLMVDSWSHLVYLEGSPGWQEKMENRRPEGGKARKDKTFEEKMAPSPAERSV